MLLRAKDLSHLEAYAAEHPLHKPLESLRANAFYEAHALLSCHDEGTYFQVCGERSSLHFEGASLFSVIDPTIPPDWIANLIFDTSWLVVGPAFLARDVDSYVSFVEGDREPMIQFWNRLRSLDARRFADPGFGISLLEPVHNAGTFVELRFCTLSCLQTLRGTLDLASVASGMLNLKGFPSRNDETRQAELSIRVGQETLPIVVRVSTSLTGLSRAIITFPVVLETGAIEYGDCGFPFEPGDLDEWLRLLPPVGNRTESPLLWRALLQPPY